MEDLHVRSCVAFLPQARLVDPDRLPDAREHGHEADDMGTSVSPSVAKPSNTPRMPRSYHSFSHNIMRPMIASTASSDKCWMCLGCTSSLPTTVHSRCAPRDFAYRLDVGPFELDPQLVGGLLKEMSDLEPLACQSAP